MTEDEIFGRIGEIFKTHKTEADRAEAIKQFLKSLSTEELRAAEEGANDLIQYFIVKGMIK